MEFQWSAEHMSHHASSKYDNDSQKTICVSYWNNHRMWLLLENLLLNTDFLFLEFCYMRFFFFFFLGGIVKVIEDYYMKEILHAKICAGFCGNNLMSPPELHVAIFLQWRMSRNSIRVLLCTSGGTWRWSHHYLVRTNWVNYHTIQYPVWSTVWYFNLIWVPKIILAQSQPIVSFGILNVHVSHVNYSTVKITMPPHYMFTFFSASPYTSSLSTGKFFKYVG